MKIEYLKEGYFKSYDNIKDVSNNPDAVAKRVISKTSKMIDDELKTLINTEGSPLRDIFDPDASRDNFIEYSHYALLELPITPAFLTETDLGENFQMFSISHTNTGANSISVDIEITSFVHIFYIINHTDFSFGVNRFRYDLYWEFNYSPINEMLSWLDELCETCREILDEYFQSHYGISVDEVKCKLVVDPNRIEMASNHSSSYVYTISNGKICHQISPRGMRQSLALGQNSEVPLYRVKVDICKNVSTAELINKFIEYVDIESVIKVLQGQMKNCYGVSATNALRRVPFSKEYCPPELISLINQITGCEDS